MTPLRIAILIDSNQDISRKYSYLLNFIHKESRLRLALVIDEAGYRRNPSLDDRNSWGFNLIIRSLFKSILRIQTDFEKRRYKHDSDSNTHVLYQQHEDGVNILKLRDKSDSYNLDIIRREKIDLILKISQSDIGEIFKSLSVYGIWYLSLSDRTMFNNGPVGIWEILKGKSTVCSSLLSIRGNERKWSVLDKGFFNRHLYSFIETRQNVEVSSQALILKNLKLFIKDPSNIVEQSLGELKYSPSVSLVPNTIGKYIFNFYYGLLKSGFSRIQGLYGKKKNQWSLYLGKGHLLTTNFEDIIKITPPRDEFWADPFLFEKEGEIFIFFENYSYRSKKGKISCGKLMNNKLIDIMDVLDLNYHLSYPYVFEEDGDIFMMPETSENKRLEIYRCLEFPNKWKLHSTHFEGEQVVDASFYKDGNDRRWLFLNKNTNTNSSFDNELHIFLVDSIAMKKIVPHEKNPVIIDSRVGRNAGPLFRFNGNTYRPSQNNTGGIYGRKLNINLIRELNLYDYEEELISVVDPTEYGNSSRMHHLHQLKNKFIIDMV